MQRPPLPNKKLTEIISKIGSKKFISIELNPYKPIDYHLLDKIGPSFCSVKWIAKQNDPKDPKQLMPVIVSKELIKKGYTVLVHLPGIFYSTHQAHEILLQLKKYGVSNIFAMRGGGPWLKIENCDFPFATDFIEFIKKEFDDYFDIVVAGFPHVHPSISAMESEMYFLRKKIDAGATIIMTQACLTSERYINYKQICTNYAIDNPIINGVLMLRSWNDFIRIKRMCSFIDKKVMSSALIAKRQNSGREHGRAHTQCILTVLLENENSLGIHIFSDNNFEIIKNILEEINANQFKAIINKNHRRRMKSNKYSKNFI